MSKRTLPIGQTVRPNAAAPALFQELETRRLMSVGPATLPDGAANDAAFDTSTKTLHVIYHDTQAKALKYQSFNDNGTKSAAETVDASAGSDMGEYLSLARGSDGVLHAAYYDNVNADLHYARRATNGVWSTTLIDSKNTTGLYPSITLDANGTPVIAYYYKTSGDLRVAKLNGSTWKISTVANTGDVGRYPSLRVDPTTNKLDVAFENTSTGGYLFADENKSWGLQTIDAATKNGGGYVSLDFINGRPAVSYYDAFNADLKYAERSSRGKWTAVTVASNGQQGMYTDLAFTYNTNVPAIAYYNKSADSTVVAFRQANGTWDLQTQTTGGGRHVTAVDGVDNGIVAPDLYLVWLDAASGDLKLDTF